MSLSIFEERIMFTLGLPFTNQTSSITHSPQLVHSQPGDSPHVLWWLIFLSKILYVWTDLWKVQCASLTPDSHGGTTWRFWGPVPRDSNSIDLDRVRHLHFLKAHHFFFILWKGIWVENHCPKPYLDHLGSVPLKLFVWLQVWGCKCFLVKFCFLHSSIFLQNVSLFWISIQFFHYLSFTKDFFQSETSGISLMCCVCVCVYL